MYVNERGGFYQHITTIVFYFKYEPILWHWLDVNMSVCFLLFAVEFEHLDLASLKSVRQFVNRFQHRGLPLHVLVNNGT